MGPSDLPKRMVEEASLLFRSSRFAEISQELSSLRLKADSVPALEEMVASLNQQKMSHADELDRAKKDAR